MTCGALLFHQDMLGEADGNLLDNKGGDLKLDLLSTKNEEQGLLMLVNSEFIGNVLWIFQGGGGCVGSVAVKAV